MALTEREEYQLRLGTPNDIGELLLDIRDTAVPGFLPDKVFSVVGDTATVIISPADILVIGLSVEVESFAFRTGDQLARTIVAAGAANMLAVINHAYSDGDGPILATNSGGDLPTGLVSGTQYFVRSTGDSTLTLHLTRETALAGTDPVVIAESSGSGTNTLGGFASEAAATEQAVGDNLLKLSAGDGRGNSPLLPVFVGVRARTLTVKGETAASILKYAFL